MAYNRERKNHMVRQRTFDEKTPKSNTKGKMKSKIISVGWKDKQHMYMLATSMMKTENHKNLPPLRTTLRAVSTSITVIE